MQQKIEWVTDLKALGILAVILGHIASPFGVFIFSWHMPLFFMVAGFFVNFSLTPKEFIKKEFKRLMVPYFIFAFVGLFVEAMKRALLHKEELDYISEFQAVFIWMDMSSLINSYAFVLWFLPALFFARLALFLVNRYTQNIVFQSLLVLLLFSISFTIDLPFGLDNGLNSLIFLFLGAIFFRFYENRKSLYLLVSILIGLFFVYGVPMLDMATKTYGNIFINILWALCIVTLFIIFFQKIALKSTTLATWGGNTMLLFIIHPYTNNIAHVVVEKLHFGGWYLKFFISLLLLQILIFIKQKFDGRGIFKYV